MVRPRSATAAAPAARPSLVDGAYEALKDAIRNNIFPPGYQGSEQEIALQLGMSRTPVHEAIIRLQEEGLVRVLSRRGVVVCAISPEDMREIYEVIVALEAAAAELIAEKPEAQRGLVAAELDAVNAAMAAALARDDLVGWAEADGRFHQLLVQRSGNARLARMFATIMDQSHRARMLTVRLRPKPSLSVEEHHGIAEAIRCGDAAAAHHRAKTHRVRARDQLLPLLTQLGMRHL
ncbi:GntR family transcriptional regulator [Falsiroseomonas oryzae]|uniref:GntR family transcriptional regulator n=1 Tax=Falsiroseomonas oryzae TaxID=2766473 RepID=UPI0022EAEA37|nr:GntR family transcriptional regulator [Roseomonas sp. MO-31]